MKKYLAIAALCLGFTASVQSVDLAQALTKIDAAQTAIREIPNQINEIRGSSEILEKLIAVQGLLTNLSNLSGPLAEAIEALNNNKIITKFIPRQLVSATTKLNSAIQDAAGAL